RARLGALRQQALEVEAAVAEGEVALGVAGPLRLRAVPGQLQAVSVRVVEVQGLVGAVVVDATERPAGLDQAAERVAEGRPGRVADGDVVKASGSRRWRGAPLRLPSVEAERVVVAAGADEERVVAHPDDD